MAGVCQKDTAANWRALNYQTGTIQQQQKNKTVMDYNPEYKKKNPWVQLNNSIHKQISNK